MSAKRPFVLSIAGFDPSGGAGVLADIKTFEQHQVYGLAIITGNTIQTEDTFQAMHWTDLDLVLKSIKVLFGKYDIKTVKIGIVPSLDFLHKIAVEIKKFSPCTKIIWDPVLKSTSGFEFSTIENQSILIDILRQIDLITPNYNEIQQFRLVKSSVEEIAIELSQNCAVLLKGGHHPLKQGFDYLFVKGKIEELKPNFSSISQKHGSGCVLSASIISNLALDYNLLLTCKKSKLYVENYLRSNNKLLGYHYV